MKRKTLALLLCAALLLTACTAAPPEPTAPTYPQAAEVSGDTIRIGQYHAQIPDGFVVDSSSDSLVALVSTEYRCIMALMAYDISTTSEDDLKSYMAQLAETAEDTRDVHTLVGDLSLKSTMWVEMGEDLDASLAVQTDFTDSWYFYRITTKYLDADAPEAAMSASIDFLASFTSDGVQPRFDFVQ